MGVRPGYKQTEVGVIPEDWEALPVGGLFIFKNGLNKAKQFFGRGTPIINYMDVFGKPSLRIDKIVGRVDVSSNELNAYSVRKGDVFFTRTSETVEEIGIASVMLDEPESTVYSGFVLRARPTNDSLDDTFKAYCFSARYFREQVIARASYTTRALTNGRSLSATVLARPPLHEQRAIATALSDVDALLVGLDRLIAKKRDLKQAAMQELLTGKTRLPGFHGEWEVKRLGDVGTFLKGTGVKKDEAESGSLPCIRYGEIYTHHSDRIRIFNSWISPEVAATATRLRQGDLLFAGSGETKEDIGKCVAFVDDYEAFAGGDIVILRVANADSMFMGYYCNTAPINAQKASMGQGDAVVHISAAALSRIEIAVPSVPEQTAIAAVLADMDAEIIALEACRVKTQSLKQAMMQELLTGRTRLI